jgi:hypothetical protein
MSMTDPYKPRLTPTNRVNPLRPFSDPYNLLLLRDLSASIYELLERRKWFLRPHVG